MTTAANTAAPTATKTGSIVHSVFNQPVSAPTDTASQELTAASPNAPPLANHLDKIDFSKARTDDAVHVHYGVIYAAYAECLVNEKASDYSANLQLLEDRCAKADIKGKTPLLMLCKLSAGDNIKNASKMSTIMQIGIARGITPELFLPWIKAEGIQGTITKYNKDGTLKKPNKKIKPAGTTGKATATSEALIQNARAKLQTEVLFTIPEDTIGIIEEGAIVECAFICKQTADGAFEVKAVVSDKAVIEAALVWYGSTL